MENSKIEWCNHTVNLWWGCYEVHKGCDNCYAKTFANRYHGPHLLWQQKGPRMLIKSAFNDLAKYQARAAKAGVKEYIFINSMSDIFEKSMPVVDFTHNPVTFKEWFGEGDNDDGTILETGHIRQKLFDMIDECPNLIFLLLTKRPSNILKMIPEHWKSSPRPNVIFMTSIVDQETADTLIPQLIEVPGLHGLSMEPLVGLVDLWGPRYRLPDGGLGSAFNWGKGVNWVIVGGESGHGARPLHPDWVRSIQADCIGGEIPFFFKQWGEYLPYCQVPNRDYSIGKTVSFPSPHNPNKINSYLKIGKGEAGSLLDGKEYKNFPL